MLCPDCLKIFSPEGKPWINYHSGSTTMQMMGGTIHKNSIEELKAAADIRCQICEPLYRRILAAHPKGYEKESLHTVLSFEWGTSIFKKDVLQIRHRRLGEGPHVFPDEEAQLVLLREEGFEGEKEEPILEDNASFQIVDSKDSPPLDNESLKEELKTKEEVEGVNTASLALEDLSLETPENAKFWPQIFKWVHECQNNHQQCPSKPITARSEWYPTRLLDLGAFPDDPQKIKLIETATTPLHGSYLTLSHRWGTNPIFLLTTENYNDLLNSISLDILPKTFIDAIHATRKLGSRYIWIDSLCIIQSGPLSKGDWTSESSLMHKVYTHSYLNLAATFATGPSTGLFFPRRGDPPPSSISIQWTGDSSDLRWKQFHGSYTIIDANIWAGQITLSPLMKRAWVFQERILARRVLHFAEDQVFWECGEKMCSENYEGGLPELSQSVMDREFRPGSRETFWKLMQRLSSKDANSNSPPPPQLVSATTTTGDESTKTIGIKPLPPPVLSPEVEHYYAHHPLWTTLIQEYTRTSLSFPSDKLPALSGIAQSFIPLLSIPLSHHNCSHVSPTPPSPGSIKYLAGHWSHTLPSSLLWHAAPLPSTNYPSFRVKEYRAPSWSWASFEGPVEWVGRAWEGDSRECAVYGVEVELKDEGWECGEVKSGWIELAGWMVEGWSEFAGWQDNDNLFISKPEKDEGEKGEGGKIVGEVGGEGEVAGSGEAQQVASVDDNEEVKKEDGEQEVVKTGAKETEEVEVEDDSWQGYCYPDEPHLLPKDRKKGDHSFHCLVVDYAMSTGGSPFVSGLMLEETGKEGEFRRVGFFQIGGEEVCEFIFRVGGKARRVRII